MRVQKRVSKFCREKIKNKDHLEVFSTSESIQRIIQEL
jgi:hypothetical protein